MVLITRTELIDKSDKVFVRIQTLSMYRHPQIGRANARRNVRLSISCLIHISEPVGAPV